MQKAFKLNFLDSNSLKVQSYQERLLFQPIRDSKGCTVSAWVKNAGGCLFP